MVLWELLLVVKLVGCELFFLVIMFFGGVFVVGIFLGMFICRDGRFGIDILNIFGCFVGFVFIIGIFIGWLVIIVICCCLFFIIFVICLVMLIVVWFSGRELIGVFVIVFVGNDVMIFDIIFGLFFVILEGSIL